MKKTTLSILIAILLIILIIFAINNLNKEKESLTTDSFISIMTNKSYSTVDALSQFSEYDYIKEVTLALNPDSSYQIEFYVLEDSSYASQFYNNNKSIFESRKDNMSVETNVNMSNYSKYTLTSAGKYHVVSRINNTVLYLSVDESYKNTINNLLEELGY